VPVVKHITRVTIVGAESKLECDAGCGEDWSSRGTLAIAGQKLRERFGDKVKLEYRDLAGTKKDSWASAWHEEIKKKNLLLPLLLVDGQLRISGNFDLRQLVDVIEADMDIGGDNEQR